MTDQPTPNVARGYSLNRQQRVGAYAATSTALRMEFNSQFPIKRKARPVPRAANRRPQTAGWKG